MNVDIHGRTPTGRNMLMYLAQHLTNVPGASNIFYVQKEIKGFKKVVTKYGNYACIANLIIPIGALINLTYSISEKLRVAQEEKELGSNKNYDIFCKLRASMAYVSSIAEIAIPHTQVDEAIPLISNRRDGGFSYKKGEYVYPTRNFSFQDEECDSGIHFFLTVKEAKDYN